MIAEGLPTKAIARRLAISAKTVDAHRSQLMERLDIHDVRISCGTPSAITSSTKPTTDRP